MLMDWSPLLPAEAMLREPGPPQLHTSGEDGSLKRPEGAGDPSGARQTRDPTGPAGQVLGTPDVCLSRSRAGGAVGVPHVAPPLRSEQFWARCQPYLQGLRPSAFGLGTPFGHSGH